MEKKLEGIDQRPSGLWRARVWDQRAAKHVSRSFNTRPEAKRWRDLARADIARRRRTAGPNQTLNQAAHVWLAGVDAGTVRNAHGRAYDPEAALRYRGHLERLVLPRFGATKVGSLERIHVQRWLDELAAAGRSATDRRNIAKPLAAIYRGLVEAGEVAHNPARGLKVEKARTRQDRMEDPDDLEMRVPGTDELRLLLAALRPQPRAVFAVALYAGLRVGEIRALEWRAVSGDEIRVDWQWPKPKLPKSNRRRVVPLFDPLRVEMERWAEASGRPREGLALGSTARDPFTPGWVQKTADEAWRDAGLLRLTPHQARHIFGSLLAAASVPRDDIMRWMGQRSEAVRLLYTHETVGARERAQGRVQALLG